MVWVFGYDYNGQSGEYWNELYTYDKVWNDSSTSDTQKITGINTNNYWIQRYGADFAPYRAMGWHDVDWRRPNQRRSGGINIGQSGSSPMEYTNGSHPRYYHLGNRFVGVCEHCVRVVGLKTGKAVFISATGATLEYDIQDWISSNDSKNTGSAGAIGSNVYYRQDGTTGAPWNDDESDFWRDCRVFRLTTDPSDDGVPAIKKYVMAESIPDVDNDFFSIDWDRNQLTNYNILQISGLGVVIPFYTTAAFSGNSSKTLGFGSPVGGFGPSQIWSGDSGTMQLVMNPSTGEWFASQVAHSASIPDLSATLRIWTGDSEYESLEPFTKDENHYYRLENPLGVGITAATGSNYTIMIPMIQGVSAAVALTAESSVNTVTSVVEIETVLSDSVIEISFDPDQSIIGNHTDIPDLTGLPNSNELWVPYASDGYTLEREIKLEIQDPNENRSAVYTWTGEPLIQPKYGFLQFETERGEVIAESVVQLPSENVGPPKSVGVTASNIVESIGTTLTCTLGVFDFTGTDTITQELYVRGFTSATGPGLTYDVNTNTIIFNLTTGTQPEMFRQFPFRYDFEATWDANGGHRILQRSTENEFPLPMIQSRDGETFDIKNFNTPTQITWIRNDGYFTDGPFILEGITYLPRGP
jgi:hypothetical protein